MATPVIMPRQGQSVESCMFTEWHVQVGESVKKGDLLFSYETDKAAFDGESPEDGILLAVFAESGDVVPVLQNIGVVGQKGESSEPFKPGMEEASTEEEKKVSEVKEEAVSAEKQLSGNLSKGVSPRARKTAEKLQIIIQGMSGSGPNGRIIERDVVGKAEKMPKATPLARSISSRDHLNLPEAGSGAGGKVTAADLRRASGVVYSDDYEEKKISNIRRIIARNMHASLQNTAQLTLHTSADARKIRIARDQIKKKMEEGQMPNITIHDMVCFATIKALLKHPEMNVHFMGETARFFTNIHLGFAVDTPRGLMVPTIKNANHLTLDGLSVQMKELAARVQDGNIDPELLQGGTFTVTNLGAFGIEMFTPVLNPPQIGILGVNTITLQPSALEGGGFGFIPVIGLSLTFDHRGIDGAPAARFLQEVKYQIERFEFA